jgi:hypothetical protein
MNGIALLHLETNNPLFIDSYRQSRATGSFILIDPLTNATVAAGMIGEDLSKRETVVRIGREQEQLAAGREAVTPQERFKRHGHLPAIFLLPNRDFLAESAERALFDNGFETISVDGDQIPSASVKSVLNPLWSAGLVVLFAAGNIPVETHRILETFAEDSLFDFVTAEPPLTHRDLASRILSQAASLRLSQHSSTSGRED